MTKNKQEEHLLQALLTSKKANLLKLANEAIYYAERAEKARAAYMLELVDILALSMALASMENDNG
jgi:hypothetical protein